MEKKYVKVIISNLSQYQAQLITREQSTRQGWYLPHNSAMHQYKAENFRVLFACETKWLL